MWRLFLRQTIILAIALVVSLYMVEKIGTYLVSSYMQSYANQVYHGPFNTLQKILLPKGSATSDAELIRNMQKLKQDMGQFKVELYHLDRLPNEMQSALHNGNLWVDPNKSYIFRQIEQRNYVLSLEPPDPSNVGLINFTAQAAMVLFLAIFYLLAIIRPFWRDLQLLRQTASQLGTGDLSARIHLKSSSSLQPLATRMNEMAERIEQLMQNQNELLNAVAHELRTPLARSRFAISMMDNASAARQSSLCASALEDMDEMETLIRELLGYGRLDSRSGQPQLQPLPAAVWLTELCSSDEYRIPIDLQLAQAPDVLFADANLLEHALANILRNAQRHAQQHVSLSCYTQGAEILICIEDDGDGIPEEQRARIFDPFIRLDDSRSRDTGGIGLGLAIVKRVVERHQGKVWVESGKGSHGACFIVCLPQSPQKVDA